MELELRTERRRRGWSLTRVGGLTNIAPSDLSQVERGLRPAFPGWQERLVDAFGVPAEKLFAVTSQARGDRRRSDR